MKFKDKSTEIFPPLLLITNLYMCIAHMQCREPKKPTKGSNFKEDDRGLPFYDVDQLYGVQDNQCTFAKLRIEDDLQTNRIAICFPTYVLYVINIIISRRSMYSSSSA